MRMQPQKDGVIHSSMKDLSVNQHHSRPVNATITNTSQVIAGVSSFNLDVALGSSDFQHARVMLRGPRGLFGVTSAYEGAEVHATRSTSQAMGHSVRDAALALGGTYIVTYSKAAGDTVLSHKVFDSDTAVANQFIALTDAVLTGSVLRLTFYNYAAGPKTLWVQGKVQAW